MSAPSNTNNLPTCMSIGPKGKTPQDELHRKNVEIIIRAAVDSKYEYKPFLQIPNLVMDDDLFNSLVNSDIVIGDLFGLNPNVLYEIGVRHAFNKPLILLANRGLEIPWDIDKNFIVFYESPIQLAHKDELVAEIQERISKIESFKRTDPKRAFNSLISALGTKAAFDGFKGDPDIKAMLQKLFNEMNSIKADIGEIMPKGHPGYASTLLGGSGHFTEASSGLINPAGIKYTPSETILGSSTSYLTGKTSSTWDDLNK